MQYTIRLICLLGITAMIGLHAAPTGGTTARLGQHETSFGDDEIDWPYGAGSAHALSTAEG